MSEMRGGERRGEERRSDLEPNPPSSCSSGATSTPAPNDWESSLSTGLDLNGNAQSVCNSGTADALSLVDMHCHLDRMSNAEEVAAEAATRGLGIFCTTIAPEDALVARKRFGGLPHVRVGAGMHPWWVADGAKQDGRTDLACELTIQSAYVGEIGLDFSPAHAKTREAQLSAFERIIAACAAHPRVGRVLSIHAVRAASAALDILERHGMAGSATCIFHWFSGTSDDLARLRRLGCRISVNERMLATKRGREYARQIPLGQLLIETDAPPQLNTLHSANELEASLNRTLETLAHLRDANKNELAHAIAQTSSRLLSI